MHRNIWIVVTFVALLICRMSRALCPEGCSCSQIHHQKLVNCANAGLRSFPQNLDRDTSFLDLTGNELTRISAADFQKLPNVEFLYLDGNYINEIEPDSFKNLPIQKLSLTGNNLISIKSNVFSHIKGDSGCQKLYDCSINLDGNPIHSIESNAFAWIANFEIKIDAVSSPVNETIFRKYSFYGASNIKKIRISSASALILEKHWLSTTENITELVISNSRIAVLESFTFEGLQGTRGILIEHCAIEEVKPYAFSGIKFRAGNAFETELSRLENTDTVETTYKVSDNPQCGGIIVFSGTDVKVLASDSFTDTNIQQIRFVDSSLFAIQPHVFRGLQCMKELDFLENNIPHGLPHLSFGSLSSVSEILFTNNEIPIIRRSVFGKSSQIGRIRFEFAADQNITLESFAFNGLMDVKELRFDGKRGYGAEVDIHKNAFNGLTGVTNLTMENVKVASLNNYEFYGIGHVERLAFINCRIDSFSSESFNSVPIKTQIETFAVTGSESDVTCDCETFDHVTYFEKMFVDHGIQCGYGDTREEIADWATGDIAEQCRITDGSKLVIQTPLSIYLILVISFIQLLQFQL